MNHFIRLHPRAEQVAGLGRYWHWTCRTCKAGGREIRRTDRDEAARRHERGEK